jgi:hypothetical protein
LLNLRLASKFLNRAVTEYDALWFRLCLGLYPKHTAQLMGCDDFSELERMCIQFSRQEFRGFGLGHEHWRGSPEGRALALKMELAADTQRHLLTTTEIPVVDRRWFAVLQARAGTPLQCMQCGEAFVERSNGADACCYHSAGSGCVFDDDDNDFVTAPHTCCDQQEGCKHGCHDAEDGILSPDWQHRSYDLAHM